LTVFLFRVAAEQLVSGRLRMIRTTACFLWYRGIRRGFNLRIQIWRRQLSMFFQL